MKIFKNPENNKEDISLLSRDSFNLLFANKYVSVEKKDNKYKSITWSEFWLKHRDRREYERIIFDPSDDNGNKNPGSYNLWKGFNINKSEVLAADSDRGCHLFKEHIRNVICSNDDKLYDFLVKYLAEMIQDPGTQHRPGIAVVLRGGQGAGKGLFVNLFGEIFGDHYVHVTSQQAVADKFNAHLKNCLFLFVDESVFAGDKSVESKLKGMITETEQYIDGKHVPAYFVRNFMRIIFASNKDYVVPMEKGDRRYQIIDVNDSEVGKQKYFDAIVEEWCDGGKESFFKYLQEVEIGNYNFRKERIATGAMVEQKLLSLEPHEKFWYDFIEKDHFFCNEFFRYEDGEFSGERHAKRIRRVEMSETSKNDAPLSEIYSAYKMYCDAHHIKYPLSIPSFSRALSKLIPDLDKSKRESKKDPFGRRSVVFKFPSLIACRKHFDNQLWSV